MSIDCNLEAPGRLLGDVGGTHARFAWQSQAGAPLLHPKVFQVHDYAKLEDAIVAYLSGLQRPVATAAVAIANPVLGDQVCMTNHHWAFSQRALRERFAWSRLLVLNDFTALALALPDLQPFELRQVGAGLAQAPAPLALLGPGTGLGVSGLIPDGRGGWLALATEGGHVSWAALTPLEQMVRAELARRYGHVSAERVASGQGLVDVFAILCADQGLMPAQDLSPADVSTAALQHGHPQALQALELFAATLGTVAGDLALTLGARAGVYVGGGIVPRLGPWFDGSPFRQRFEDKGRFSGYLASIPTWVITTEPSPAMLGAARALDGAS